MTHDPFRAGRYGFAQGRIIRLKPWQLVVVSAAAIALVLALVVAAAGVFLLLFPVLLIGGLIWRFAGRFRNNPPPDNGRGPADKDEIVDAEYVILTDRRNEER